MLRLPATLRQWLVVKVASTPKQSLSVIGLNESAAIARVARVASVHLEAKAVYLARATI